MMTEIQQGRVVEVLGLPEGVDDELLTLYFENRHRSGGGHLVSVEKTGHCAVLVFEEAEAAARVLSKDHHVIHNTELIVRKPASKDPCRFVLKGFNPSTSIETIQLFVEVQMALGDQDYSLLPLADRTQILIQLSQPLAQGMLRLHHLKLYCVTVLYRLLSMEILLLCLECSGVWH
uniref:RRM domain-containing protein n=1 Tax=Periophthalmus magnuspinnatus TaxID=409849 RepID=A0A3B3ZDK2_9GOBI